MMDSVFRFRIGMTFMCPKMFETAIPITHFDTKVLRLMTFADEFGCNLEDRKILGASGMMLAGFAVSGLVAEW